MKPDDKHRHRLFTAVLSSMGCLDEGEDRGAKAFR